ncbi:hypothetical protein [Herbiconiux sp. SALV-R1]|uniref:hypothetical protein n=1 Tax=unclassified Herbiconiux TaxID=2618217 RepID=UPI00352C6471
MPENIEAWWSRRQRSKGVKVPYPVGSYREAWAPYAVLKRQYHPDLNRGITLTQIPPAADVYLTWQCEVGHYFIATPAEQRSRPGGGVRRRSVWCTLCTLLANPPRIAPAKPPVAERAPGSPLSALGAPAPARAAPPKPPSRRRRAATGLPSSHADATGNPGVQGTAGSQGTRDTTGSRGTQGIASSRGTHGTTSSRGTHGTVGSRGTQGTAGSRGAPGTVGGRGTQGSAGSRGMQGTTGSRDAHDTAGSQDTKGTAGSQGTEGTVGGRGTPGSAGSRGTHGTTGGGPGTTAARPDWAGGRGRAAGVPRVESATPSPGAAVPGSIAWLESSGAVIDEVPTVRAPGQAFWSARAPKPASAAEAELRQRLGARLDLDLGLNAIAVRQPFFGKLEVWPDFVLAELAVAVEFDTPGRFGLEHLGSRLDVDRRKDRLLRAVGWEVVRIRCGSLPLLGEHDIAASGVSARLVDRLLDTLREVRGPFLVDAYLCEPEAKRAAGERA